MHTWCDWIQSSIIDFLGIGDELELEEGGRSSYELDNRAFSTFESNEVDLVSILQYDRYNKLIEFNQNIQMCSICENEIIGKEMIRLSCSHYFCQDCITRLIRIATNDNAVHRLACPDRNCKAPNDRTSNRQTIATNRRIRSLGENPPNKDS